MNSSLTIVKWILTAAMDMAMRTFSIWFGITEEDDINIIQRGSRVDEVYYWIHV